jgi:hypothetical protein
MQLRLVLFAMRITEKPTSLLLEIYLSSIQK